MKYTYWVILIGILTWISLSIVGFVSHGVGEIFSDVFHGTMLEQTGNAITGFGDTAFAAFWMILVMAAIITLGVVYFKARTTS